VCKVGCEKFIEKLHIIHYATIDLRNFRGVKCIQNDARFSNLGPGSEMKETDETNEMECKEIKNAQNYC